MGFLEGLLQGLQPAPGNIANTVLRGWDAERKTRAQQKAIAREEVSRRIAANDWIGAREAAREAGLSEDAADATVTTGQQKYMKGLPYADFQAQYGMGMDRGSATPIQQGPTAEFPQGSTFTPRDPAGIPDEIIRSIIPGRAAEGQALLEERMRVAEEDAMKTATFRRQGDKVIWDRQQDIYKNIRSNMAAGLHDVAIDQASKIQDDILVDSIIAKRDHDRDVLTEKRRRAAGTDSAKLRKEYLSQSKAFIVARDAFSRVLGSVEDIDETGGAGDLALIFNFMKIQDPGSVVRESEFAVAEATAALWQRAIARLKGMATGQRLTAAQRANFVTRAHILFRKRIGAQERVITEYERLAVQGGMAKDIFPKHMMSGDEYDLIKGGYNFNPSTQKWEPGKKQKGK